MSVDCLRASKLVTLGQIDDSERKGSAQEPESYNVFLLSNYFFILDACPGHILESTYRFEIKHEWPMRNPDRINNDDNDGDDDDYDNDDDYDDICSTYF